MELLRRYSNHHLQLSRLQKLVDLPRRNPVEQRRHIKPVRRLDEVTKVELGDAYKAGATVDELAKRFGIHRTTVMNDLKRVTVRTRFNILTEDQIEEAARLYKEGWSLMRLGAKYGVSDCTVLNAFRKNGVQTRPRRGSTRTHQSNDPRS